MHAQGRFAEAFKAYSACNAELRRIHAHRFSRPGVETIPQYLDWVIGYFLRARQDEWVVTEPATSTEAAGPAKHVFIIGFPRSGTTLLESILGCHPDAVTTDERDGFGDGVRAFMAMPTGLDRLAALRGPDVTHYRALYWQRMQERGIEHGSRVFIDKQPYNTVKLPLIAKLFPGAPIIFAVRDPRDVILSCFRQRFRMNPSNFELLTLESAARFYDQTMRLADLYRAKLSLNIRQVRHEDIVSNFDDEVRAMCAFLGIAWSDAIRSFGDRARRRDIATPSANQVARGLNQTGMAQWRNYADELAPVLPILAPWVERFGYDTR